MDRSELKSLVEAEELLDMSRSENFVKTKVIIVTGICLTLGLTQSSASDIAAGETAYAAVCANCHGRTGKGMASFPSVAGKEEDYLATRLTQYRAGEKVGPNSLLMIPMAANLSDEDIANLAAFVSTTFQ